MNQEIIFKKNIFGGFNRKQVIDCISQISRESVGGSRTEIEKTNNHIHELEKILQEKDKRIQELNCELEDLDNHNTSKEIIGMSAIVNADFKIATARDEVNEIRQTLQSGINSKNSKFENLFSKITAITAELEKISMNLNSVSQKIDSVAFEQDDNPHEISSDDSSIEDIEISDTIYSAEETTNITPFISQPVEVIPKAEAKNITTPEEEEIQLISDEVPDEIFDDNFNYIDNFFAELDKLYGDQIIEEPYVSIIKADHDNQSDND